MINPIKQECIPIHMTSVSIHVVLLPTGKRRISMAAPMLSCKTSADVIAMYGFGILFDSQSTSEITQQTCNHSESCEAKLRSSMLSLIATLLYPFAFLGDSFASHESCLTGTTTKLDVTEYHSHHAHSRHFTHMHPPSSPHESP